STRQARLLASPLLSSLSRLPPRPPHLLPHGSGRVVRPPPRRVLARPHPYSACPPGLEPLCRHFLEHRLLDPHQRVCPIRCLSLAHTLALAQKAAASGP